MSEIRPEGSLINNAVNKNALSSVQGIKDAMVKNIILEGRAALCDKDHNLHIDLGVMKGIIPRNEGAIGIEEGYVRDIALISRVGKSVCFTVEDIRRNSEGKLYAILSRKKAQQKAQKFYVDNLVRGDVIDVKITHLESFGAFCDIGAGITALLPIEAISVSRIPHPSARFFVGQNIKCIVAGRDERGRISLSHKELLGTWEENAALFRIGETVPGIIRSVESYGVFIELTPNLAGLAEYDPDVKEGMSAAVYIKNIIPERKKIKLIIVDYNEEKQSPGEIKYFFKGEHLELKDNWGKG
ncbi:MAG: 30S ribosomal protein S1 [Ruminococcaceae bacterium]|nr:30S ribosomal protein S1 [Oscillospiraceae bacterium]